MPSPTSPSSASSSPKGASPRSKSKPPGSKSEPPRAKSKPPGSKSKPPRRQVFAPGARVVVRDEEWMVRSTRGTSTGGAAVHVTGLSELVRGKEAIFLTELDEVQELRPEATQLVMDLSPQFRRSKLYLESLRRKTPPTDNKLYVGHQGAMDRADYQLVPAAKALSQPRARILIADGVGLGKTIEVGVLLSELIRRGQGERILVVALKSILEQFQKELWGRFTIPLVRLDSVGLERVRSKIPSNMNPFYYFNRVIISIDTLKQDTKYRTFLEQCRWDAVVIDECQHVAVRTRGTSSRKSQRAKLAGLLGNTCDALILTSATPHDGTPQSFASLMNLLEPTAVADPNDYTKDDVKGLFVRRFKKDVARDLNEAFKPRALMLDRLEVSPEEDAVFAALAEAEFRTVSRGHKSRGVLFRTLLLKAFLSSPEACRSTIQERLKHKDLREEEEGDDAQHDRQVLGSLLEVLAAVTPAKLSKLSRLMHWLETLGYAKPKAAKRVVIFSERIQTLAMLEAALKKRFKLKSGQIEVFHGTLDDRRQQALVADFGNAGTDMRILLASDAASEGINLHHHCHHLIHFDVPWSLITLEQRNGRIDRYGQHHQPDIRYLLNVPSDETLKGDLRVLERLIEKEDAANQNLGDVAWLMNLHDPLAEEERIGVAISNHEAAESVVPDEPQVDGMHALLMASLGMDAAGDAAGSAAGVAAGADGSEAGAGLEASPEIGEMASLYRDDLSYAEAAFEQLAMSESAQQGGGAKEGGIIVPSFEKAQKGFTLSMPDDLVRRYAYLPPELYRKDGELRLTIDRERVKKSLEDVRQRANSWPEWELFWNQHPVAEWLNDRVLSVFTRHEAPVLRVPRGVGDSEALFLFQGVLSNGRSQPVIVKWFGMRWAVGKGGKATLSVIDDDALLAQTGLAGDLSNAATAIDLGALAAGLEPAVEAARQHMAEAREARSQAVGPALRAEQRRVKRWHRASLAQIDEAVARRSAKRRLRQLEEAQFEAQRERLERLMHMRSEWVKDGLRTEPMPYLRVAAVLISQGRV